MKVVVLGDRGYMGQKFLALYSGAVPADIDVADRSAVASFLDGEKPDVVINCAGKTGVPNVDWCESHREETLHSNVTGVGILVEECSQRGLYMVHLSSGCIYEGDNGGRGFDEEAIPNFSGSFYSRTKAWSDQLCRDFASFPKGGGILTLRLRMPFDGSDAPRNLLTKLRRYTSILDVENSLTYIPDFLRAAQELILQKKTGVYNIVNDGTISPFNIMELYREIVDPAHIVLPLSLTDLSTVTVAGRSNCVLSNEKLKAEGIVLQPVEQAVRAAWTEVAARKIVV